MATLRGTSNFYNVGNTPPRVAWTVVRGDTAAFKVYVTDDEKVPLDLSDWSIEMQIKRPTSSENSGAITDAATLIMTLHPEQDPDDGPGEFTTSLTAAQSKILNTGDIFDIELSTSQDQLVWTVAQGSMIILEDVTD
jgi:hypothetical protein